MRKTFRQSHVIMLLSLIIMSGCSLHKLRTEEYPLPMPDSYTKESQTNGALALTEKWWLYFKDEELNKIIEEALKKNLDIEQAYERLRQSEALFRSAGSLRWPQLNIEGKGGKVQQKGLIEPVISESYSLSAAAGYELDIWRKLSMRSNAAKLDAIASKNDLMALYMSISATAADLYYLAAEQQEQLMLADRVIASFRDTQERVELRYREGVVPAIDVYQSRQNLASAEAQRPTFEANYQTTLNALSVLLRRFPKKGAWFIHNGLPDMPVFASGIPSELVQKRPDIQAALMRLMASDERVGAAIADRLPSFNLIGTYGGSSDRLRTILDSPNILWSILLQLSQPILDGGRRKAEAERSEALFRERLASYHKSILEAFREVEDALVKNKESEQRLILLGKRALAAEAELRLAVENYMQGLSDYLPVLTAQQRYYEGERLLLNAKRGLASARITLARSLGGDWMEREMEHIKASRNIKKEEEN